MFGSVALDVVIGLVFVYLLYSLLATLLMEIFSTHRSLRAKNLRQAIKRMLDDNTGNSALSSAFYDHPLIKYLGESEDKKLPAYFNTGTFSKVMIDLLRGDAMELGQDPKSHIAATLKKNIISFHNSQIAINSDTLKFLNSIWLDAQGDVTELEQKLENWFDETMERASGWYKKKIQKLLFAIGLVLAIAFNVDTFKIVEKLQKDPKLREQLVTQAGAFVKAHPNLVEELKNIREQNRREMAISFPDSSSNSYKMEMKRRDSIATEEFKRNKAQRDLLLTKADSLVKTDIAKANGLLGIGLGTFDCKLCTVSCLLKALGGWILTALALSFGAPFWFDILNKLIKLRSSVASSSSDSQPEKKQDNRTLIKRKG